MSTPTLLRHAEHEALRKIALSGSVLDLGGDKRSSYRTVFPGTHTLTTLNADPKAAPDILHDLEMPLPVETASFDAVLLINVLEHIFRYQALLVESVRALKPGGQIVVVVPFLFPKHPSPYDYCRFTAEMLQKGLGDAGFENVRIELLGGGVFSACYLMLDRLLPNAFRFVNYYSVRYLVSALDATFTFIARVLKKKYDPAHYALGYCATAKKPIAVH